MGYKVSHSTRHLLRIYFIMKVCGVYLYDSRTSRGCYIFYPVYAFILWAFSLVDFIRVLLLFENAEPFGTQLVHKILTALAYSASVIVYTSSFFARRYFLEFHDSWVKILHHRSTKSIAYKDYSAHLRNVSMGLYAMFLTMPLGLFIYHVAYVLNSSPELDAREILIPIWFKDLPPQLYYTLSIFHVVFKTASTLAGCGFAALIIVISAILTREFATLRDEFVEYAVDVGWFHDVDSEQFSRSLSFPTSPGSYALIERTRLLHHQLTKLLAAADNLFSTCFGCALLCAMAMTILITFNAAVSYRGMMDIDAFVIYVILLIIFAAAAQLVIIGGSVAVNMAAHSFTHEFYGLDLRKISGEEIKSLQIFIQRLTAESIGFTAMRLFTISTGSVLTIVGALVTYTVVIFEVTGADPCEGLDADNTTALYYNHTSG